MTRLGSFPAKKVLKKLKKFGFGETHQRGSHLYLKSKDGKRIVTVPVHSSKDIHIGTLHNIVVKQAGLSVEEFNNL